MIFFWLVCGLSLISISNGWDTKRRNFSDEFMFGAASAAFQIEGAWNEDGKGESIWDTFTHQHPELIPDGINGDVAADSYHLWQRDVEMLRELGVDFYRFSISWPRVMPTGFPNELNEKGLEYYDNLINELLKYNIEPMVTLYHFDLPQKLQDLGGWANPLVADWFEDYSKVIFDRYADRVKYWITINQPNAVCGSYGDLTMSAPGIGAKGIGEYVCAKHSLLAHAKVYRLYEKSYKSIYNGQVGITLSVNWADPIDQEPENIQAVEEFREFYIGLYMNPIWSAEGDFPKLVKDIVAEKSKKQGFPRSRLPTLSREEINLIKGSSDFLGMNHYTTFLVKRSTEPSLGVSYAEDFPVELSHGAEWMSSKSWWLKSAPYGLYKLCLHLNKNYNYLPIIITENGWSTGTGLTDQDRVYNLKAYLGALLLAIEDGTRVRGYAAWSLMDNVEWIYGTSERFGLYEVDFDSPDKKRTARLSALVYKHVIEHRTPEDGFTTKNLNIEVSDRRLKMKNVKVESQN